MIYARVDAMNIVDFARVSEECGFESVWQADHTHRPVTEVERPLLKQGTLHDHAFLEDQWVVLGAMAAVTSQVKLGTAITLVMQRDPIVLAKEVATVDQISGGRVILGVGFGHQRSPYVKEMLNHGTTRETRFDVVRERVLAMREIWTKEEAEFHGKPRELRSNLVVPETPAAAMPAGAAGLQRRALSQALGTAAGLVARLL